MGQWEIIGIAPTNNEEYIKKAYLSKLNEFNPESDAKGFMILRRAYENILEEVRNTKTMHELSLKAFIEKLDEIYNDFSRRIDEQEWIRLLQYSICQELEMEDEVCHSILKYFMVNHLVPHEILTILNDQFKWTENKEELYELFPKDFIDFIVANVLYEDRIRYRLFSIEDQKNTERIDHFLQGFLQFLNAINTNDIEESDDLLEQLKEMNIKHIDFSIEQIKYELFIKQDIKKAWVEAQVLLPYINKDNNALYWFVRIEREIDLSEAFYTYLPSLLLIEDGKSKKLAGDILFDIGKYEEALECYDYAKKLGMSEREIDLSSAICHKNLAQSYSQSQLAKTYKWEIFQHYYQGKCYQQAIEIWNTLDEKDKGSKRGLEDAANSFHILGFYDEAIECRNALLAYANSNEEIAGIYLDIGKEYEEKKENDIALAYYEETILQDSENGLNYYIRARLLYSVGRIEEALFDCKRALELEEEQIPYTLVLMAEIMYEYGQYELVKEYCSKALAISFIERSLTLLLKVNYISEDYKEVVRVAEEAFNNEVCNEDILYFYGCSLREMERYEDAEIILNKMDAEIKDKEITRYELAELYYRMHQYEKALTKIEESIKLGKLTNNKYYLKINILMELLEYEGVITLINEHTVHEIPSMFEFFCLGKCYSKLDNNEMAIQCFKEILKHNTKNIHALIEVADCYQKIGKLHEAISCYEKAIEYLNEYGDFEGRQACTYSKIGKCYVKFKKYSEAEKMFQTAIEIDKTNGDSYLAYGQYFYSESKDYLRATYYFEEAYRRDNDNAYYALCVGKAYERLNNTKKANRYFNISLRLALTLIGEDLYSPSYNELVAKVHMNSLQDERIEAFICEAIKKGPLKSYLDNNY